MYAESSARRYITCVSPTEKMRLLSASRCLGLLHATDYTAIFPVRLREDVATK